MLGRNIFRQKALDKLAAPDELDRLLTVVGIKAWIPLGSAGFLCLVVLAWSIFGRIPITVNGMGVLINPGNVKGLQSQATGQLIELPLRVGQLIEKGDIIGVLNQPELRKQLEQSESRMTELTEGDKASDELEATRWELEQKSNGAQRQYLGEEITKLEEMAEALLDKDQKYKEVQRKNLDRTKDLSLKLHESIEKHFQQLLGLKAEGLAAGPLVLNSERDVTESQLRLAGIEVQLRELDLREIQGAEKYLEQRNRVSDLTLQLKQLDITEQRLRQQQIESNTQRESQISDARRQVERFKLDLDRQSQVRSCGSRGCGR